MPETDHNQDGHQNQDKNMGGNADDSAYVIDPGEDLYATDDGGVVGMDEVDGRNLGMIYFLSFNTLTFFART
jgi:hypothetical protein